jgi:AcrR family transcriptional regulator
MAPTTQLRRAPLQARSRDRVARFLDVADVLLAEEGAAALSTVRVAEAAGASIGTLYHWFPDKEAIIEALALRYWDELAEILDAVTVDRGHDRVEELVGRVIDSLADGFRARPGFLALWYGGLRSERVRDVTRPGRVRAQHSIERMLAATHPAASAQERATVARMVVLIGDGVLREAFRLDRDGDPGVLAEGRHALRAYTDSRLKESP